MIYKLNSATPIVLMGDEPRYLQYAQNLLHGYFSPKGQVDLWSGPGYPLFIAAFMKMGFQVIGLRLLNAFLQYASIVLLFKTIQYWTSQQKAFWLSMAWACYYIAFKEMLYVYTEPLTSLLIVMIAFSISKWSSTNNTTSASTSEHLYSTSEDLYSKNEPSIQQYWHLIIAGILIGYLALVKIIFGYVILFCLIVFLLVWLIKRHKTNFQLALIFLIALITTLPYLMYTKSITGRNFYWGNSGGMSLYWMSTPVASEYGDWNDAKFRAYCDYDTTVPCNATLFAKNHQADYDAIYQLDGVARDDAFKQKAIENIKAHPLKYFQNILANTSRLFFAIPNSYQTLRIQNVFRIIPNVLVFCGFIYCIIFSIRVRKQLTPALYLMLLLLFAYLGATLLVSAQQRQLYVVLPLIIIWFAWLNARFLKH
jgi:4-amino-4-deoxy-L-arabinose transferase-like glycosyltransferase